MDSASQVRVSPRISTVRLRRLASFTSFPAGLSSSSPSHCYSCSCDSCCGSFRRGSLVSRLCMPLNFPRQHGPSIAARISIVAVVLLSSALYLTHASQAEEIPPRQSLASFPMTLEGWAGRREPDFTRDVL